MTGVIKSNRCGTCRKRKVKCDEVKPVCGPCQKGNRHCEKPISKVKFTKPKEPSDKVVLKPEVRCNRQRALQIFDEISVLRSTATEEGGSFQTLRMGRLKKSPDAVVKLPRQPPLSPVETLQLILLETFSCLQPGLRLTTTANWIKEIPPRLGQSAALDDSIACLVNCHGILCRGQYPGDDQTQNNAYAKALFSLHKALGDGVECYTDNTLCAVTILALIEMFGGGAQGPTGPKFINHAGGAARLIEVLGPKHFQTDFAKVLLFSQRGPSVTVSILRGEECFLNTPEWLAIEYDHMIQTRAEAMCTEIVQHMMGLPSLLKKVRAFYDLPNEPGRQNILREAQKYRRGMQSAAEFVADALEKGTEVLELPAVSPDSLTPFIYDFTSRSMANACIFHWAFSTVIDTIIARFLPIDSPPSAIDILRNRCIAARQRVLMSVSYTEQFWPLGAMFMSGPLIMVYNGALPEERTWIMHKMWHIGELIPNSKVFWGPVGLEIGSKFFLGEPITVMSQKEDSKDSYAVSWNENFKKVLDRFNALDLSVVDGKFGFREAEDCKVAELYRAEAYLNGPTEEESGGVDFDDLIEAY